MKFLIELFTWHTCIYSKTLKVSQCHPHQIGISAVEICKRTIFCIRWRDRGRHGRDRMVVEFTNVSSKLIHGEVYSIQHYVINVCQWLTTGQWFYQGTPVSPTNKTDLHDITEILLKVALNTINQPILHKRQIKKNIFISIYKFNNLIKIRSVHLLFLILFAWPLHGSKSSDPILIRLHFLKNFF